MTNKLADARAEFRQRRRADLPALPEDERELHDLLLDQRLFHWEPRIAANRAETLRSLDDRAAFVDLDYWAMQYRRAFREDGIMARAGVPTDDIERQHLAHNLIWFDKMHARCIGLTTRARLDRETDRPWEQLALF